MRLPWSVAVAIVLAAGLARADAVPRWQTLPRPPAMPAATTTGRVTVGDAKLFYATYGEGAPVIVLHGGLGNADHWGFQVPALAATHRVIAIDSRGHGRSTLGTAPRDYHAMAGDVLAVMDQLRIERAAIVGWSDGGAIALDLAIHHPARVARLFVLGTTYDASGAKPRAGGSSATFRAYATRCRRDHARLGGGRQAHDATRAAMRPIWRAPGGFAKAQLRAIRTPTVIAGGAHDEIVRVDHLRELAALIPGAQLVVFDDASHFALWQTPAQVTRAIVAWLTAG